VWCTLRSETLCLTHMPVSKFVNLCFSLLYDCTSLTPYTTVPQSSVHTTDNLLLESCDASTVNDHLHQTNPQIFNFNLANKRFTSSRQNHLNILLLHQTTWTCVITLQCKIMHMHTLASSTQSLFLQNKDPMACYYSKKICNMPTVGK